MSHTTMDTKKANECSTARKHLRQANYRVVESPEAFQVHVDLPGVSREGIDLSIENDTLSIRASRVDLVPGGWKQLRRELAQGDYFLNLKLNVALDQSGIAATVENGVLRLDLPKSEEIKARKIRVS